MKKKESHNKLKDIEESLDRIACSLSSISGVLDNLYLEVVEEVKREEEKLKEEASRGVRTQRKYEDFI